MAELKPEIEYERTVERLKYTMESIVKHIQWAKDNLVVCQHLFADLKRVGKLLIKKGG